MTWQFIIAGLTLGLIGSLHCVGMCGPLSLALPIQYLYKGQRIVAIIFYQIGRVITYSTLGLIFGLAGRRVYLAGFQQWFSIGMGILILFLLVQYWLFRKRVQPGLFNKFYLAIQKLMIKILKTRGMIPFLFFGIANGFLPCGMVYIALAGALVTTEVQHSILFMAMFGMGTMPAMFAVIFFGRFFSLRVRNSFRKIVPVFISAMAVILILRGMNLGIPFISPVLQSAPATAVSCH
ncbi:MAG: sulfite exporter TauE/SafE family protein [Chitinophagales bacterium]